MTTANDVYQTALALIGEDSQSRHYDGRALAGINLFLAELTPLDRALRGIPSRSASSVLTVNDLSDEINAVDLISRTLLPVALSAFLLNEEEERRASFFYQTYRAEKEILLRAFAPGRRHAVREVY